MDAAPVTGLSHYQLHVSDLAASGAWYQGALGMTELPTAPERVALYSRAGKFRIVLSKGGQPDNRGAVNHIAFGVTDLAALTAWTEHLDAIGIAHNGIEPTVVGHSVDLFDPDGNNIELVSESKRPAASQ